jgi:hypothetical protein
MTTKRVFKWGDLIEISMLGSMNIEDVIPLLQSLQIEPPPVPEDAWVSCLGHSWASNGHILVRDDSFTPYVFQQDWWFRKDARLTADQLEKFLQSNPVEGSGKAQISYNKASDKWRIQTDLASAEVANRYGMCLARYELWWRGPRFPVIGVENGEAVIYVMPLVC